MVVVAVAALANGASPVAVSVAFGNGFWSLITFTMQMAFVAIGGYVVATSAPAQRLIGWLADLPRPAPARSALSLLVSILASLLNWGLSLILGGLLVVALAARRELRMDYRAAGAAAYLGLGATWAMGLSSSAAQLQANAASLPKNLLSISGVIPFSRNHLSVAIGRDHCGASRGLGRHRDLVGARTQHCGNRRSDGDRSHA